jgi:transposase
LNTHKESTTRGFLFVALLGLIIRMKLLKRMKETEVSENYSLEMLMLELEKVRKIKLANVTVVVSELTKRQRELLKTLQLCAY